MTSLLQNRCAARPFSALGALFLLTLLPAVAVAAGAAPKIANPPQYRCVGKETTLTDSNTESVQNGGTPPTFSTKGRTYCLLQIVDYHWNDGQGATPGTVGLTVVSGLGGAGNVIGPLPAIGSAGQNGVQNANWTGTAAQAPQPVVINGHYSCLDSDPATWSQNAKSGGQGFCTLTVKRAIKAKPPKPATPTYTCSGSQVTLFDSSNFLGVLNGAKLPNFFTATTAMPGVFSWCLNSISTYHWNDGAGATPGKIGLRRGGINLGAPAVSVPLQQATGSAGQGGAANVNWTVNYPSSNPVIISGAYFCDDSDPATWAQNALSGGKGFCTVYATPAYVTNFTLPTGFSVPQPAPPTGPAPTAPAPSGQSCSTNTYGLPIVFPNHVAPGGQTTVLLACGTKAANSFTAALTPTGGAFTVPYGNCLNGVPPPTQPFITYGTGPGQVNPNFCPNSIQSVPWSVVPGNPLALQITAPSAPGQYLVFVRTVRGDLGTASILNVP